MKYHHPDQPTLGELIIAKLEECLTAAIEQGDWQTAANVAQLLDRNLRILNERRAR